MELLQRQGWGGDGQETFCFSGASTQAEGHEEKTDKTRGNLVEKEDERKKMWKSTDESSVVLQFSVAAEGFGQVNEFVPLSILCVQQSVLVVLALRLSRPSVDVRHHALNR